MGAPIPCDIAGYKKLIKVMTHNVVIPPHLLAPALLCQRMWWDSPIPCDVAKYKMLVKVMTHDIVILPHLPAPALPPLHPYLNTFAAL